MPPFSINMPISKPQLKQIVLLFKFEKKAIQNISQSISHIKMATQNQEFYYISFPQFIKGKFSIEELTNKFIYPKPVDTDCLQLALVFNFIKNSILKMRIEKLVWLKEKIQENKININEQKMQQVIKYLMTKCQNLLQIMNMPKFEEVREQVLSEICETRKPGEMQQINNIANILLFKSNQVINISVQDTIKVFADNMNLSIVLINVDERKKMQSIGARAKFESNQDDETLLVLLKHEKQYYEVSSINEKQYQQEMKYEWQNFTQKNIQIMTRQQEAESTNILKNQTNQQNVKIPEEAKDTKQVLIPTTFNQTEKENITEIGKNNNIDSEKQFKESIQIAGILRTTTETENNNTSKKIAEKQKSIEFMQDQIKEKDFKQNKSTLVNNLTSASISSTTNNTPMLLQAVDLSTKPLISSSENSTQQQPEEKSTELELLKIQLLEKNKNIEIMKLKIADSDKLVQEQQNLIDKLKESFQSNQKSYETRFNLLLSENSQLKENLNKVIGEVNTLNQTFIQMKETHMNQKEQFYKIFNQNHTEKLKLYQELENTQLENTNLKQRIHSQRETTPGLDDNAPSKIRQKDDAEKSHQPSISKRRKKSWVSFLNPFSWGKN